MFYKLNLDECKKLPDNGDFVIYGLLDFIHSNNSDMMPLYAGSTFDAVLNTLNEYFTDVKFALNDDELIVDCKYRGRLAGLTIRKFTIKNYKKMIKRWSKKFSYKELKENTVAIGPEIERN